MIELAILVLIYVILCTILILVVSKKYDEIDRVQMYCTSKRQKEEYEREKSNLITRLLLGVFLSAVVMVVIGLIIVCWHAYRSEVLLQSGALIKTYKNTRQFYINMLKYET